MIVWELAEPCVSLRTSSTLSNLCHLLCHILSTWWWVVYVNVTATIVYCCVLPCHVSYELMSFTHPPRTFVLVVGSRVWLQPLFSPVNWCGHMYVTGTYEMTRYLPCSITSGRTRLVHWTSWVYIDMLLTWDSWDPHHFLCTMIIKCAWWTGHTYLPERHGTVVR